MVIQCYTGLGRIKLVAAAVAKRLLGVLGEAAITWVRRFIPRAIETPEQRRLLVDNNLEERDPTRAL